MDTLRERLEEAALPGGELDLGMDVEPVIDVLAPEIIENRERIQKLETSVTALKIMLRKLIK